MSIRARILIFLAVLIACAASPLAAPWPMVIGCAAYLVLVLPTIGDRR